MRRALLARLVALGLGALAPGCTLDDSGTGLTFRLEISAQAALEDLRVTGYSPDTDERFTLTPDLAGADAVSAPFVLDLGPVPPGLYVIALRGESARGTLLATRCFTITEPFVDDVLMIGPLGALDGDGDGFPGDAFEGCAEPLPGGGVRTCGPEDGLCPMEIGGDCDDTNPRIFPGAAFANTCQDGVDDDCDGDVDEACADLDADGFTACPPTPTPVCDCDDTSPDIRPGGVEICEDAVDQDCDGVDAFCDRDSDGVPSNVDCDDDNPLVYPGASEAPIDDLCDGLDNDCNGAIDDHPGCLGPDLDGDGVPFCEPGTVDTSRCDCNDCDSGIHGTNADRTVVGIERCGPRPDPLVPGNGVDDDCDGSVDEGCALADEDGDGRVPPADCDDEDPLTYPQTGGQWIERCGDGIAQNCVPGAEEEVCATGDLDGDGFVEPAACEADAAINPSVAEACNMIDDDCDGTIDEVVGGDGSSGCARGMTLNFTSNFVHCGGCRVACPAGVTNVCVGGVCDCSTEPGVGACSAETGTAACCPSGCADLETDAANCGGCGLACGLGESCVAGRCTCGSETATVGVQACPDPGSVESNACCAGTCRDVTTDSSNCGGCGIVCGPHSACAGGGCQCDPPGAADWRDCNGATSDGCETNVRTSEASCGACGRSCSPPRATGQCTGGDCRIGSCDSSYADCDGTVANGCETNIANDEANCGSCGGRCDLPNASAHGCVSGSCRVSACDGGWADCDSSSGNGCEVRLGTDTNCGSCGDACGPNAFCAGGGCQCAAGALDCTASAGCETLFSTNDCGGCGVTCRPGEGCDATGRCTCGGAAGGVGEGAACGTDDWTQCCADVCTDTRFDPFNCGVCGYYCGPSAFCSDSICIFL